MESQLDDMWAFWEIWPVILKTGLHLTGFMTLELFPDSSIFFHFFIFLKLLILTLKPVLLHNKLVANPILTVIADTLGPPHCRGRWGIILELHPRLYISWIFKFPPCFQFSILVANQYWCQIFLFSKCSLALTSQN